MLTIDRSPSHFRPVLWAIIGCLLPLLPGCKEREAPTPAALNQAEETAPTSPTPNVVFLLIDTLRADRLGAYGYAKPTSPHIDRLAAESVVFDRCYAPAPWTLPSVVSILTSMYPCEHGVLVDGQKINAAVEPLAVRLKKIGYATCSIYANGYVGPMSGLVRGYDLHKAVRAVDGAAVESWLPSVAGRPFLLYLHNVEPHKPYAAPDRLVELFGSDSQRFKPMVGRLSLYYRRLTRADFHAKRALGSTDNTVQQQQVLRRMDGLKDHFEVLYDAAVRQADERAGSIIEVLKRRGLWDDTLFVLLSDHGEEMGEHGGWQHDQSVYEELMRAPLIVHFPGGRFAGRRVNEVVSLVDLMPTVFDYLRRPDLAGGLRGQSLMPLVRGDTSRDSQELIITGMRANRKKFYLPYKETRGDTNVALRQGPWKGIFNAEIGTLELYNLAEDPGEQVDLSTQHPERADAMRDYAEAWLSSCRADAQDVTSDGLETLDEETTQTLRSLGYVD